MSSPMNYGSGGKRLRFAKRYDFDLPATKKAAPTQLPKPPSAEQLNRQIATDERMAFRSDAEAVLVNLSLGTWTSRAELRKALTAKRVTFDDKYIARLLDDLLRRNKVKKQGDTWKRS